jgi:hypothetical protein
LELTSYELEPSTQATTLLSKANPAYEKAGAEATESITAVRVTNALNFQGRSAARYEAHLSEVETDGLCLPRQGL